MTARTVEANIPDETYEMIKNGVQTVEVAVRNVNTQQWHSYIKASIKNNHLEEMLQKIRQHSKPVIIAGSLITVTAVGCRYAKDKFAKRDIINIQNFITAFNKIFLQYFEKIRNGDLDEDTVDMLLHAIDNLLKYKNNVKVDILNSKLRDSVTIISEYTKVFATANSVTLDNYNVLYKSPIETLRYCLMYQKQIFIETD